MAYRAKIGFIFSSAFTLMVMTGCFKEEVYPLEPVISEPNVDYYADSIVVSFKFTDGDANIGLNDADTTGEYSQFAPSSPYYHNVFMDYYEKDDQLGWVRGKDIAGDSIVFKYRIKRLDLPAKTEGIKGSMNVTVHKSDLNNPFSDQDDTIKYAIRIVDRSLNVSNVLETNEIYLP